MALKAKLNQALYDALVADVKKEYKKVGDSFQLDVEAVDGLNLEDVTGLRSALESERNALASLKTTIKAFDGLDPTKIKADLAAAQALIADPTQKAVTEAKISSITEQLEKKHADALKPFVDKNAFLEKQVHKALKESTAVQAITASKGSTKLLLPHVLAAISVVEEDGNLVPRVVDEKGQIRITQKSGSTAPMEIVEYVELMKNQDDFKSAFLGTQMSGGGSQTGNNGAGGSGKFVLTEAIARDPRQYAALKEAATKAGQQIEIPAPSNSLR